MLDFLLATIILNQYQQHLFNISNLVINNILQCILESFACGTRLFLHGDSSSIFVASLSFTLCSDCSFSTLTWSIARFPCLLELFNHLSNHITANMKIFAMEELLSLFLRRCIERHRFLSLVISWVKLTNIYLWNKIYILMNKFNR